MSLLNVTVGLGDLRQPGYSSMGDIPAEVLSASIAQEKRAGREAMISFVKIDPINELKLNIEQAAIALRQGGYANLAEYIDGQLKEIACGSTRNEHLVAIHRLLAIQDWIYRMFSDSGPLSNRVTVPGISERTYVPASGDSQSQYCFPHSIENP